MTILLLDQDSFYFGALHWLSYSELNVPFCKKKFSLKTYFRYVLHELLNIFSKKPHLFWTAEEADAYRRATIQANASQPFVQGEPMNVEPALEGLNLGHGGTETFSTPTIEAQTVEPAESQSTQLVTPPEPVVLDGIEKSRWNLLHRLLLHPAQLRPRLFTLTATDTYRQKSGRQVNEFQVLLVSCIAIGSSTAAYLATTDFHRHPEILTSMMETRATVDEVKLFVKKEFKNDVDFKREKTILPYLDARCPGDLGQRS